MYEGTFGWNPEWQPDPYDPQLARDLLAQAGYPDAFANPVVKYYVSPSFGVDLAQVMLGYWDAVGLQVEIEIIDSVEWWGMFFIRVDDPNDPGVGGIFPFVGGSTFDNIYHCANQYKTVGVHGTGWDPMADQLYDEAVKMLDDDLRKQKWTEFQEYVYDEMFVNCPFVILEVLFPISDKIGEITENQHLSLADAYAGMKHP